MPSFGRKRLGLASTARQAGQGSTIFDSRACGPALPGGLFICRSRRKRGRADGCKTRCGTNLLLMARRANERGGVRVAEQVAFNVDCMEYMRTLPDKAFDLAVVDPPYGIGMDGQKSCVCKNPKHNRKEHEKKEWDSKIPDELYFRELERVSKNQIIWGANYFVKHLEQGHKGWIVWDKGQHGLTMSDCELAYSTFDCPTRVIVKNRVELRKDGTFHPTQKPIALYAWIFSRYAKPGDKILDTHLGSGSSRIAAYDARLDFVGTEIDAEYFRLQEERWAAYTAQIRMW